MPLCCRSKDREPAQGLGSEGMDLLGSNSRPRDPRATFLGYNGKPEGSKGVNPKFPNFGKFRAGTANDRVINVCKDVDGKRGKVGAVADLARLKDVIAECRREQKRAEDRHSPWNMPSTTSKESKSCWPAGM